MLHVKLLIWNRNRYLDTKDTDTSDLVETDIVETIGTLSFFWGEEFIFSITGAFCFILWSLEEMLDREKEVCPQEVNYSIDTAWGAFSVKLDIDTDTLCIDEGGSVFHCAEVMPPKYEEKFPKVPWMSFPNGRRMPY
jgi:hypothetical protein